ncbi:MAG: NFACT family protein [Bacilli bacterium]
MPIDSMFTLYLAKELNRDLHNAKIKKIYNINSNDFLFKFQNKLDVYISSSNECRINVTNKTYSFPTKPLNFTMLLRKYLGNKKVINVCAYQKDRIIRVEFSGLNEAKDLTTYYLYIELFGRYSNIILTKFDNTIINSLKYVNNNFKTILPNYKYYIEAKDTYFISPKVNISIEKLTNVYVCACATKDDFYFTKVFKEESESFTSLSSLLDHFYQKDCNNDNVNILLKKCTAKIKQDYKKTKNKVNVLKKELQKNSKYKIYKIYGDLILTYGYNKKISNYLVCNDFDGNKVKININKNISISDNANSYYNKYAKLKRSITHINNQITATYHRLDYLDNLLFQLSIANENEIVILCNDYLHISHKNKTVKKINIMTIENTDYKILIGKNNLQNEEITFKLSNKNDIWFHVKDLPGSHVLLKSDNITDDQILLAASYAATYSKAKNYPKVDVVYTNVKNVKKISGSYPGHVSIINEKKIITVNNKNNFIKP